jgi:hypothetical protein
VCGAVLVVAEDLPRDVDVRDGSVILLEVSLPANAWRAARVHRCTVCFERWREVPVDTLRWLFIAARLEDWRVARLRVEEARLARWREDMRALRARSGIERAAENAGS